MNNNTYNAEDLNSVLQTLSSLAPQPQTQIPQHTPTPNSLNCTSSSTHVPTSRTEDPRQSQPRPSSVRPSVSKSGTDPSTITTWPAALRHVMRTVSQNEETQLRIRGMIRSQHSHERNWFQAREALIKQQQGRPQKQRELDAVLRSIGAPVKEDDGSTEQQLAAEISAYDLKVHAAAIKMSDALFAELRGMGIPFFTLRKDLVQDSPSSEGSGGTLRQNRADSTAASMPITKPELMKLQQRMLELLEDLCKE